MFFQVNLGQPVPLGSSSFTHSGTEPQGIRATRCFTGRLSFLPPSDRRRSTWGNTEWPGLILSSSTTGLL